MVYGILAGGILGFYDFWTKKAMEDNEVIPIVFWSSLFGAAAWLPAFLPFTGNSLFVDLTRTNVSEQLVIFCKSFAMTASWGLAYFAVRELPISYAGAVRASGPLWTLAGGLVVFGEFLSALQLSAVMLSVAAYYVLATVGKKEGVTLLRSLPLAMMLAATLLSALTTVFDKVLVQRIGVSLHDVQCYSAIQRCLLAGFVYALVIANRSTERSVRWNMSIGLVGLSWVAAEFVYFLAIAEPQANVTYLSIFRRFSLVVGFMLSVLFFKERNIGLKSVVILLIVVSGIILVLGAA